MPSKRWSGTDIKQRAHDILDSIEAIREFIAGTDKSDFVTDRKTRSAVEYELLQISEAAAKIRDIQVRSGVPVSSGIDAYYPKWSAICAIGNRLRHEYGRVDDEIIWETVAGSDLRDLEDAVRTFFLL